MYETFNFNNIFIFISTSNNITFTYFQELLLVFFECLHSKLYLHFCFIKIYSICIHTRLPNYFDYTQFFVNNNLFTLTIGTIENFTISFSKCICLIIAFSNTLLTDNFKNDDIFHLRITYVDFQRTTPSKKIKGTFKYSE